MTARLAASTLALLALAAAPLAAQDRGAYLVRLGTDTIAVESYIRTASRLDVDQVYRAPRTTLRHYVVEFGADGAVTRAEAAVFSPGAPDRAIQSVRVTFHGDSASWETRRGDSAVTRTVSAPAGTVPIFGPYSTLSLLTEKARRARMDSVSVMVQSGPGQAFPVVVQRLGRDSMLVQLANGTVRARVGRDGRFLGSVAPTATAHHIVSAMASADVRVLALEFAARDSAGQAMGVLSPRDTVRATVGGANLLVDYGRPMKRGREIFGGIVPWNQVWRTGANAATQLRTDRDLVIGGVAVPAGTYTLWSLPAPDGWKLIVNRQTGQWGTEYHEAQDLGRIDLQTEMLPAPIERFTIALVPEGAAGLLRFAWDRTQASVRFTVR